MSELSEIDYFSQPELWSHSPVEEQHQVAQDIMSLIPEQVHSILDAGCGNGTVVNKLNKQGAVFGCDLSLVALKQVNAPKVVANISHLPYKDKAFDLVLSSDVIEHIPEEVYAKTRSELARVTKRYILIAVPFKEILKAAEVICPCCTHAYHAHLHQRSYDVSHLEQLFGKDFGIKKIKFSGERWLYTDENLVNLKRYLTDIDYSFENALCPKCKTPRGKGNFTPNAQEIARRMDAFQAMLSQNRIQPLPNKSEVVILFEKGIKSIPINISLEQNREPYPFETINIQQLKLVTKIPNYPEKMIGVKDNQYFIIVLPLLPLHLKIKSGTCLSVEVYNSVQDQYLVCESIKSDVFRVPQVPNDARGCLLRIMDFSSDLVLIPDFDIKRTKNDILTICFSENYHSTQVKDLLLRLEDTCNLANKLESQRAELDKALLSAQVINATQADTFYEALNKAKEDQQSISELMQSLELQKAQVDKERMDLLEKNTKQARIFQEDLTKAKEEQQNLNQLIQSLESQKAQLEKECLALKETNTKQAHIFQEDLTKAKEEQQNLNQLIQSLESQKAQLEKECLALKETNTKQAHIFQEDLTKAKEEEQNLNQLIQSLESQKAQLEKEYLALQEKNTNQAHIIQEHLTKAKEEEQNFNQLIQSLESQKVQLEKECSDLKETNTNQTQAFEVEREETQEAHKKLKQLISALEAQQKLLQEINIKQVHAFDTELTKAKMEYSDLDKKREGLNTKVLSLELFNENQTKNFHTQISVITDNNHKLNQEVEELSLEMEALNIILPIKKSKIEQKTKDILIVSHMYPRDYNKTGGIFVHEQVKMLKTKGLNVRVLTGEPFWINTYNPLKINNALKYFKNNKVIWEEYEDIPVLKFPYIVSNRLPFQLHANSYTLGAMRYVNYLRETFNFNLIHAHTSYLDGSAANKLATQFKVPYLITEHTGPFSTLTRTPYLKRKTTSAIKSSSGLITVSQSLLNDMGRQVKNIDLRKAVVIPNMVNTETFSISMLPKNKRDLIYMLWVGHFVPIKRIPVLLEAMAIACKALPQLRLRLVGSGEGESEARAYAEKLGITSYIEFSGHATQEALKDFYHASDFLVISSESETFGVVAIEAMSCGLPVLTTNCGGPEETVTDPALGLVVGKSSEDMADGIHKMVASLDNFNPELIQRVAELRFSTTQIYNQLQEMYAQL